MSETELVKKTMADPDEVGGFLNYIREITNNPEWLKTVSDRKSKQKQELMKFMGQWLSQGNVKDDIQKACAIQLADEYGLDPRMGLLCVIEGRIYLDDRTLTYLHQTRKEFQHLRFIGRLCTAEELDFLKDKYGKPPSYAYCYECRTVQGGVDVLLGVEYGTVTDAEAKATFKSGSPTVPNKYPRQMAMTRARVRCMKHFIVPIKEHSIESYADIMEISASDYTVEQMQEPKILPEPTVKESLTVEPPPVRDSRTPEPPPVVKESLTTEPPAPPDKTKLTAQQEMFNILKENIEQLNNDCEQVFEDIDLISAIDKYMAMKERKFTTIKSIRENIPAFLDDIVKSSCLPT